jgi:xanthine dehydrogenase accessory factor
MNQAHLRRALEWADEGTAVARGTVVNIEGSAPRDPGTTIFVRPDALVLGTLSGGCVEQDVVARCIDVIEDDRGAVTTYGPEVIADEDPFAIGLTCGGSIDVLTASMARDVQAFALLSASLESDRAASLVTVVEGMHTGRAVVAAGPTLAGLEDEPALRDTLGPLAHGSIDPGPERPRTLVQRFHSRPKMFVFGVSDFCAALTRLGRTLGYRTIACDARGSFMTRDRFPDADEVLVGRPDEVLAGAQVDARTVICCMSHDRRWDVPALRRALRTPAAYIGMIGSRNAQEDVRAALRAEGVSDGDMQRISGPMGLDLHARSPEEVAVSIAAEVLLVTKGGSARRLVDTEGPVRGQPR